MKRAPAILALLLAGGMLGRAGATELLVHTPPDGKLPGWSMRAPVPPGWTGDCCNYARGIGVDAVIYHGEWTGDPQRVIVLDSWAAKLPTLAAEIAADTKAYVARDPHASTQPWPLPAMPARCQGVLHHGSDHVDDVVVFCDPGKAAGVRYSWSMAVQAGDPARASLLASFGRVVAGARFAIVAGRPPGPPTRAAATRAATPSH